MVLNTHSSTRVPAPKSCLEAASSFRFFSAILLLAIVAFQSGCVGLTAGDASRALAFSPVKIDFGQVVAGSKKSQPVTLTNTGTSALTVPQATLAGASYTFTGLTLPMTL